LPRAIESVLYRVVQEAVTNTVKHADATQLTVTVNVSRDEVTVTIADDGVGFDVAAALAPSSRPFGLLGMRERVASLGGTVGIVSDRDEGTIVEVRVPLDGGGDDV
jgi:signal transduction histidine kinase